MWEAYSHEVSSCGYWPGPPGEEGIFYAYAYPEPPGYRNTIVLPAGARWDHDTADDPDAVLRTFLQSTYDAAATTAFWDRAALDRPTGASDHG
jgi:hypothetical protein